MAKTSAEDAAGQISRLRRRYLAYYARVARGECSSSLGREIRISRESLNKLLANLDCLPRPIWTKLLGHYHSLEKAREDAALKLKSTQPSE